MNLTEAEDIKRWQQYTEVYKKDLHGPDNHYGVITHLGPDILECEVTLSAVILQPKKTKSVTASTFPPSICHEVMGLDALICSPKQF